MPCLLVILSAAKDLPPGARRSFGSSGLRLTALRMTEWEAQDDRVGAQNDSAGTQDGRVGAQAPFVMEPGNKESRKANNDRYIKNRDSPDFLSQCAGVLSAE